jgi:hypothetical protein
MNTNRKTTITENRNNITASNLIRGAGVAAIGAGVLYIGVQAIHPLDVLSSVTTARWAIVHYLSFAMDFLGLLGITGIYARQVEKAGWLGVAGYFLFSLFWVITAAFHFAEAFISPLLVTEAPRFVVGFLGIITSDPSEMNLGALPAIYALNGLLYMLGGLLFGIATFRARVLPRWAAGLLAVGIVLPILGSSLVPHPFDRIFAVPVGLALAWLGYALLSEHREKSSESLLDQRTVKAEPSKAA